MLGVGDDLDLGIARRHGGGGLEDSGRRGRGGEEEIYRVRVRLSRSTTNDGVVDPFSCRRRRLAAAEWFRWE